MEEDVPIEHPIINRATEDAQKKSRATNFDIRKSLLEIRRRHEPARKDHLCAATSRCWKVRTCPSCPRRSKRPASSAGARGVGPGHGRQTLSGGWRAWPERLTHEAATPVCRRFSSRRQPGHGSPRSGQVPLRTLPTVRRLF